MHFIGVTSWRQTSGAVFHFPFSKSGCFPKTRKVDLTRSNQRLSSARADCSPPHFQPTAYNEKRYRRLRVPLALTLPNSSKRDAMTVSLARRSFSLVCPSTPHAPRRRPICYIRPFQKDTVGIVIESSRITNERRPLAAPLLPISFINDYPCLSVGKFRPNSYGLRALGLFIPGGS